MTAKKTIAKKVLKAVEKVARHEITRSNSEWPPHCMGIYHQPKRPTKR